MYVARPIGMDAVTTSYTLISYSQGKSGVPSETVGANL